MVELSAVVTIMNRGEYLGRCLEALHGQRHAPQMEIVVPVFPSLDGVAAFEQSWPGVRFVKIPELPPSDSRGFSHWKIDRRRAIGVSVARGGVIAMTDEFAIPNDRWCRMLFDRARESGAEVVGGAILPAARSLANRAVFYCDFARFMPPFEPGECGFASLANLAYTKTALDECGDSWRDLLDETVVNERIIRNGGRIWLDSSVAVDYDPGERPLFAVLTGKYESGRTYAGRRAESLTRALRMQYAAGAFLLPVILLSRKFVGVTRRGADVRPFLAAAPLLLLILMAWSAGEFTGYVTARPFPRKIPAQGARAAA